MTKKLIIPLITYTSCNGNLSGKLVGFSGVFSLSIASNNVGPLYHGIFSDFLATLSPCKEAIGINGTFDDFGLAINPLGLTETAVSFVTSPLHVPVRRLFNKGLPDNGVEACKEMWQAADEVEESK